VYHHIQFSVVTVFETAAETYVFFQNRPSLKPRFFPAWIAGFQADQYAEFVKLNSVVFIQ